MELRPGYQLTEVGELPEDWEVLALKEICIQILDGTHFTPTYVGSGVPFYSVENVTSGNFESTKFVSEAAHELMAKRCRPKRGDILMTRITAGKIGDTKLIDWDCEASIYVSLALLKIGDRVVPEYLYAYSKSELFVAAVEKRALTNATPKKINLGEIGEIPIASPKEKIEQRAIAAALSDVDAALTGLERLIAKKRDLKQATMQQLLTGESRLPGFSGEWKDQPLHGVCSMKSGSQITVDKIDNHSAYPCYGGNGLRGYTSEFTHDGRFCLIGRQGALCGNVVEASGKFFASEHAIVVTPNTDSDIHFLSIIFERMNLNQYSESSAQPGLSVKKLLILRLVIPPSKAEQSAIAAVLSDMDAELAALQAQRDKTRLLKQGMMQELLTGRIRLPIPAEAPEVKYG